MDTLLFDFITNEIKETNNKEIHNILIQKKQQYKDINYTIGNYYFGNVTIYFIRNNKDNNKDFGRFYLENKANNYLGNI